MDLLRDTGGATIIEFALVAGPFIALLFAVLQTSLIYFAQEALETAVETAARTVITGQAQATDATGSASGMSPDQLQARFKTAACASLPTFLSCSNLLVDVRSATDWNSLDTSFPAFDVNGNPINKLSYSLGTQGNRIMVRLMYLWPVQAPLQLGLVNSGTNNHLIVATSVAKSETYTS